MTSPFTRNRRRAAALAVPALALPLVLGACKKDEPTTATSNTPVTAQSGGGSNQSGSNQTAVATTPQAKTWEINQAVWTQGFKVTFGKAAYNPTDYEVGIDVTIENLGEDSGTLFSTWTLQQGDVEIASGSMTENKQITGGGKTSDKLVFSGVGTGKDKFVPEQTAIKVGSGNEQQGSIPLTGEGGQVVNLEPIEQKTPGPLTIGTVTLTPELVQVRYDDPNNHTQAPKGKAFLFVNGTGKNSADSGTLFWDTGKAVLVLPNGNTESMKFDDPGNFDAGKSTKFMVGWEIPSEDFPGDYTVKFTQAWGPEGAEVTVEGQLTLVGAPMTSGGPSGTTKGTTKGK